MNAKHTPGPWIVEEVDTLLEVCNEETLFTVARVFRHEQNARLISAAPELLEALQSAIGMLRGCQETPERVERYERARAAIAKATGK